MCYYLNVQYQGQMVNNQKSFEIPERMFMDIVLFGSKSRSLRVLKPTYLGIVMFETVLYTYYLAFVSLLKLLLFALSFLIVSVKLVITAALIRNLRVELK